MKVLRSTEEEQQKQNINQPQDLKGLIKFIHSFILLKYVPLKIGATQIPTFMFNLLNSELL